MLAFGVEAAEFEMVPKGERHRSRRSHPADLDRVVVVDTIGNPIVRGVGHLCQECRSVNLELAEVLFGRSQLLLLFAEDDELFWCRPTFRSGRGPQRIDRRRTRPPGGVGDEEGVEDLRAALTGDPAAASLRIRPCGRDVDQRRPPFGFERRRRSTLRRPLVFGARDFRSWQAYDAGGLSGDGHAPRSCPTNAPLATAEAESSTRSPPRNARRSRRCRYFGSRSFMIADER